MAQIKRQIILILKRRCLCGSELLNLMRLQVGLRTLKGELSSYRRRGEIGSAPLQDIPRYRDELQTLLQNYELKNIFNCDELALYWRLEPSKTLAYAPVWGEKTPERSNYSYDYL